LYEGCKHGNGNSKDKDGKDSKDSNSNGNTKDCIFDPFSIQNIFTIHYKKSLTTTMNFSLTLLSAVALFLVAAAQPYIIGGKYPVNPTGADVVKAANFALSDRYVLEDIDYKILSAEKQAVSGEYFFLTISVAETDPTVCTVMRYEVQEVSTKVSSTTLYILPVITELSLNYQQCAWLPAA
jgi:hypothetical protein